jgi:hypothetical protein
VLARARTADDRDRNRLLVVAVAAAGALAGTAVAIGRLPADRELRDLAPYVAQPGLRIGVVVATLSLVLPVALLALQALRLGGAERARRSRALSLVGATPAQRRMVEALRTGRAGLLGGLLAGPAQGLLWVLLGWLPPTGVRLVPPPVPADLVTWAVLVGLGGLVGVLTGAAAGGRGVRPPAAAVPWPAVAVALLAAAAAVAAPAWPTVGAAVAAAAVVALLVREPLVARVVRRLRRRGTAVDVLVAARLTADPRSAGRAAAVLALAGLAFGVQGGFAATVPDRDDAAFYFVGVGLAAAVTVVAVLVVLFSLVVAAADQVVTTRRAVAALAALGAEAAVHRRVLTRQLTVLSLPAALAGCTAGLLLHGGYSLLLAASGALDAAPGAAARLLVPLPLTALLVVAGARAAVALVDRPLRAAANPAGLRAP